MDEVSSFVRLDLPLPWR